MDAIRRSSLIYNAAPALEAGVPKEEIAKHIQEIDLEINELGLEANLSSLAMSSRVELQFKKSQQYNEPIEDVLILRPKEEQSDEPEIVIPRRGSRIASVDKQKARQFPKGTIEQPEKTGFKDKLKKLTGKVPIIVPKESMLALINKATMAESPKQLTQAGILA
ncbi:MAG: hypothetical protein K0Q50_446 [Vampirovibrio sp.]|jgi:hypothetical protein|nr:hypothetical protein [Vampirovibrio sp.]